MYKNEASQNQTFQKRLPSSYNEPAKKAATYLPKGEETSAVYKKAEFLIDPRYELVCVLGQGSYGTVCSAVDTHANKAVKTMVAIKKVTKIFSKEVLLKRAIRELKLMVFFKGHKNIVNLIDMDLVYQEPYDGLYCFQELMDHDLARVIIGSAQFSNLTIQSFIYQICCGVKYMHSADVIHRDLKPNNILVSAQGTLKICDFGLARGINEKWMNYKRNRHITSYVATRWYRAPELILAKKMYGKEVDMWSVGCIVGELYGRKPLFIGDDSMKQVLEICKVIGMPTKENIYWYGTSSAFAFFHEQPMYQKKRWETVYPLMPAECVSLIDGLLTWNPVKRLKIDEVLAHPFLKSVRNADEEIERGAVFDFEFEVKYQTMNDMKLLLHQEVSAFKAQKTRGYGSKGKGI